MKNSCYECEYLLTVEDYRYDPIDVEMKCTLRGIADWWNDKFPFKQTKCEYFRQGQDAKTKQIRDVDGKLVEEIIVK